MPWMTLLRAGPWLAILALLGALAFQTDRAGDWKERATSCQKLRTAEHEAYRSAQREAAEKNKATVERIEREQEKANAEVVSDLNARLERLRSELRGKAGTPQSPAGGTSLPQAPGGSPATPEAGVCLAPDHFLRAAENEERHDRLIDLVERLLAR